ncbi:hypothetical protein As57867_007173, partial [Aphanomyces stellatus]
VHPWTNDEDDVIESSHPFALPHGEAEVEADGTTEWCWPRMSAAILWHRWFHGDASLRFGWRYMDASTLPTASQAKATASRVVAQALVDIALAHDMASSEDELAAMARGDLMHVFDGALRIWLHDNPNGNVADRSTLLHLLEVTVLLAHVQWRQATLCASCVKTTTFRPHQPVRTFWLQWFRGDATNGTCPFRFLSPKMLGGRDPILLDWIITLTRWLSQPRWCHRKAC